MTRHVAKRWLRGVMVIAVVTLAWIATPLASPAWATGVVVPTVTLSVQYSPTGANSLYPSNSDAGATVTVSVEGTTAGGPPTGTVTLNVPTSEIAPQGTLSDCDDVALVASATNSVGATATCTLTIHDFCPFVVSNPQAVRAGQQTEYECCPETSTSTSADPAYQGSQCAGSGNQTTDGTARYILKFGEQSITASYSGDSTYASASSPSGNLNISPISCVDSVMEMSSAPGCSNVNDATGGGLEGVTPTTGAPIGNPPEGTPDVSGLPNPNVPQSGPDPAVVLLPPSGSGSSVYAVFVPSGAYIAEYLVTESAGGTVSCLNNCAETVFNGNNGLSAIAGGSPYVTVATFGGVSYYVLADSLAVSVTSTATSKCTRMSFAPVPATTTAAATPILFTPDTSDSLCDYTLTSAGVPNGTAMDASLVSTGGGSSSWWLIFSSQPSGNNSLQTVAIKFLPPTASDPLPSWSTNGSTPIGLMNEQKAHVLVREGTDTLDTSVEHAVESQPISGVPWLHDPGNNWRALENPAMIEIDPAGAAPSPHCDVTDAKDNGLDVCYMLAFSLGTYGPAFGPGGAINYCPDAGNWCSYPWNYNTLQLPCLYEEHARTWACNATQTTLLIGSAGGLSLSPVTAVSSTETAPTLATAESGETVLGVWSTWAYKDLANVNKLVRQTFVGEFTAT